MLLSREARSIAWEDVIAAPPETRVVRVHMLASAASELLGPPLGRAGELGAPVDSAYVMLAESERLNVVALREAFEGLDGRASAARTFAQGLGFALRQLADVLEGARRQAAESLAGTFSEVATSVPPDDEFVSVAEVADAYGVTPQAVYKWVESGRIDSDRTPGGTVRVPTAQFEGIDFDRVRRAQALRRELKLDGEAASAPSRGDTAQIVKRRRRGQD